LCAIVFVRWLLLGMVVMIVLNPCRYIGEIREAITRSGDDATVQVFRIIMNILGAEYSVGDLCLC
jgi:hypothetical protein